MSLNKQEIEETKAIIQRWIAQGRIRFRGNTVPLTEAERQNIDRVNNSVSVRESKLAELANNKEYLRSQIALFTGRDDSRVVLMKERLDAVNAEIKVIEANGTPQFTGAQARS